ncbi:hypothetical protein GWK47_037353 [Chionoecetes opilio]|uniref:Uncharacterized protein n=1 Tax=Chionoecetes opilio TaxID=41210 RepID=A0A8J5CZB1_CHIOP|nr:hypothetical protein GWK47_037353 [Chionoecetes opilio]
MRAMTRLNAAPTFYASACTMCRLCAPCGLLTPPVIIAVSHISRSGSRCSEKCHEDHAGGPRWSAPALMQSETRLVPLATQGAGAHGLRVARVFRRGRGGVAQRRLGLAMTQGIECLRGNTWLIKHLASQPQPHSRGDTRAVAGGRCPAPTYNAPTVGATRRPEFTATQLPACKAMCTTREAAAARADGHARSASGTAVYTH